MLEGSDTEIRFVKLTGPDCMLACPEQDFRHADVYAEDGRRIGRVGDLYIDHQQREVRFLEVDAGGFLGMGEKHILIPVEEITEVAEGRVNVAGDPSYNPSLVPPTAGRRRDVAPLADKGKRPFRLEVSRAEPRETLRGAHGADALKDASATMVSADILPDGPR